MISRILKARIPAGWAGKGRVVEMNGKRKVTARIAMIVLCLMLSLVFSGETVRKPLKSSEG